MLAFITAAALMSGIAALPVSAMYDPDNPVPDDGQPHILSAPASSGVQLQVCGQILTVTPTPFTNAEGRWMLPLRAISEAMGYDVTYNQQEHSVSLVKGPQTAVVSIGSDRYSRSGDNQLIQASPSVIVDGYTFVPSRFFSDVLGKVVIQENTLISIEENKILRENGDTVFIKEGETFSVELSENLSTGYAWQYDLTPAEGIVLTDEAVVKKTADALGAPSLKGWLFTAEKAGHYSLLFTYGRSSAPLENDKTKTFTIAVEKGTTTPGTEEDTAIGAALGETFAIRLPQNPTTGYTWTYKIAPETGLSIVSDQDIPGDNQEGMVGVPGEKAVTFRADQPGSYAVTFVYDRSFAPSENPETRVYQITVK